MYQQIKITIDTAVYFFTKPKFLYHDGKLYTATVNNSATMVWKIKGKSISYKKLKKAHEKAKWNTLTANVLKSPIL
jgi:hypothetical protein